MLLGWACYAVVSPCQSAASEIYVVCQQLEGKLDLSLQNHNMEGEKKTTQIRRGRADIAKRGIKSVFHAESSSGMTYGLRGFAAVFVHI